MNRSKRIETGPARGGPSGAPPGAPTTKKRLFIRIMGCPPGPMKEGVPHGFCAQFPWARADPAKVEPLESPGKAGALPK